MKTVRGSEARAAQSGTAKSCGAAALLIFCVFTASALTVLALGVNADRNMTDISMEGYGDRVSLSYIWTKVKNGDEAGNVYAGDFHGLSALYIDETYDGVAYHTVIYHHEGRVCELFFEDGLEFYPEDGVPVAENGSLSFEPIDGGLIKVSAGTEDAGSENVVHSLFIFPRAVSAGAAEGGL